MGMHTPGPWKLLNDGRQAIVRLDDGELIADLDIVDNDQANANARLIAAAPELLSLAIEFRETIHAEWCSSDGTHCEECDAASAMIKATRGTEHD